MIFQLASLAIKYEATCLLLTRENVKIKLLEK